MDKIRCELCDYYDCTCRCRRCGLLSTECICTEYDKEIEEIKIRFTKDGGDEESWNRILQRHFYIMYRNSKG